MSKLPTEFPYEATATFSTRYLKDGQHVAILPMDSQLLELIGLVTAYWCDFETKLNGMIEHLLPQLDRHEPNWARRSFKKRKALLLELLDSCKFVQNHDQGMAAFKAIMSRAGELSWRRNIVVHGTYNPCLAPFSSNVHFRAIGHHNGRRVELSLDPETLNQLWHDIAHIGGAMVEALKIVGDIEGFWPTLPDRYFLQLQQKMDSQNPPSSQAPQPPPQS